MNSNNTIRLGAAALAVVVTSGLAVGYTFAHDRVDYEVMGQKNNANFVDKVEWQAQHEAAKAAVDSGDYNAFVEAVGSDSPILEKINETNFTKFVEAHQLMQAGDRDGAKAIFDELGLERGVFGGPMGHRGHSKGQFDKGNNKAVMEAMDNGDYKAWLEAVGEDSKMAGEVTQEVFSKMVEAHQLMQAGDRDGAKAIFDELGLERGPKGPWNK